MAAAMNYALFMRAALAEAALAAGEGERADGAVAVLDEAMVARARRSVRATGDPTAHAVMSLLREASRRLGRRWQPGMTVFSAVEPCAMCTGALLQAQVDTIVFALADAREGACTSVVRLADAPGLPQRLRIVSGILQEAAADLRPDLAIGAAAR
jgi:tRNA(adenine34) deaminase